MKANELKEKLETTLNGLISGSIQPEKANSIAKQSREILRIQKEKRDIYNQIGLVLDNSFVEWAK